MLTVLITGVGSNIGQGIMKAVNSSSLDARLVCTDIEPLSAGLFRCDSGYVVPPVRSPDCLDTFMEIVRKESVDAILTGSDPETLFFSLHKEDIESKTGAKVIISSSEVVKTFQDKWLAARFFEKTGLGHPKTLAPENSTIEEIKASMAFPLVVKPRAGAGSRNVFIVRSEEELAHALSTADEPIVQELVQGEEYTSGLLFDRDSQLKGIITMKRDLSFGTTYRAQASDFPEVKSHLLQVAGELSELGAIGPMNVQFIFSGNRLYVIEINPRFSGTTAFRAQLGFNDVEASLNHFVLAKPASELVPSEGVVMRFWEEAYITKEDMDKIRANGHTEGPTARIYRGF
jgi:carbamoyl-phosphate synthase large subunit